MNPVVAYVLVVGVVLALGVLAMTLRIAPQRQCPTCGSAVQITRRRCGRCRHTFTEQVMRLR